MWRPTSSLDTGPCFVSLKYSQGFPKALLTLPHVALRNNLKLAAGLLLCLQSDPGYLSWPEDLRVFPGRMRLGVRGCSPFPGSQCESCIGGAPCGRGRCRAFNPWEPMGSRETGRNGTSEDLSAPGSLLSHLQRNRDWLFLPHGQKKCSEKWLEVQNHMCSWAFCKSNPIENVPCGQL